MTYRFGIWRFVSYDIGTLHNLPDLMGDKATRVAVLRGVMGAMGAHHTPDLSWPQSNHVDANS